MKIRDMRAESSEKLIVYLQQVHLENISIGSNWRHVQQNKKFNQNFNPMLGEKRREVAKILTILKERGITKEMAYAKVTS